MSESSTGAAFCKQPQQPADPAAAVFCKVDADSPQDCLLTSAAKSHVQRTLALHTSNPIARRMPGPSPYTTVSLPFFLLRCLILHHGALLFLGLQQRETEKEKKTPKPHPNFMVLYPVLARSGPFSFSCTFPSPLAARIFIARPHYLAVSPCSSLPLFTVLSLVLRHPHPPFVPYKRRRRRPSALLIRHSSASHCKK